MNERKTAAGRVEIDEFLIHSKSIPVLDVRSPAEFEAGHMIGATSMPIFSNEERAIVGTLYKKEGRKIAIKVGLDIFGPKMRNLVEAAEQLDSDTIGVYCWRGGMRSASIAWLLETYGFQVMILDGGYKAYRNAMLDYFAQSLPLWVVTGYTGSKKTHFLHLLQKNGEQVIDLEGLAGHQGSSFGNKKSTGQPTTEHFQNMVFEKFRNLDLNCRIWIEDESIRIGNVNLTQTLFDQMGKSPHILLEVDREERVDFLKEDYAGISEADWIDATLSVERRLGGKNTAEAIQSIKNGDTRKAIEIILKYYDSNYQRSIEKKKDLILKRIPLKMDQLEDLARKFSEETEYAI